MKIQEKLNEINEFIESKILKGDFEFVRVSENELYSIIKVDETEVSIWTYSNVSGLEIFDIKMDGKLKNQIEVKKVLKPKIDAYVKDNIIAKKEAELAKLKAELS